MLSLTKELDNQFDYQGVKFTIDLAFDTVLRWYEMMEDDSHSDLDKAALGFQMFFNAPATDADLLMKANEGIADYIRQGPYGNDHDEGEFEQNDPVKDYSFTQDGGAIYSSFIQQYGIDLVDEQGKLHWDKFKALFDGLGDQTYFKQIIKIRQMSTNGLKGEELASLVESQKFYQLDSNRSVDRTQNDRLNDVFNALANEAQS